MKITLRDIRKQYGKVNANDGIDLEIHEGSIHGILGENGAGKSTLMKVLAGYTARTSGTILLDGQPSQYDHPSQATRLGIGMLYQDPLDFPPLTVLENFMMGLDHGLVSREEAYRHRLAEMADHFGFHLDPGTTVERLTVGERQQLELVRLLALGVEVLILDEPTTGISTLQKQALFSALRKLAAEGKTILLVSHKLEDVEALCDRITVLRRGRVEGDMGLPFEGGKLLKWMFGNELAPPPCFDRRTEEGVLTLAMEGVSALGGRAGLNSCRVAVRKGEVVGLAGLEGSGQGLFLRLASGLERPKAGKILVAGEDMTGRDHHAYRDKGVTFLPAGRLEEGLMPGLTITEHFAIQQQKGIIIHWPNAWDKARQGIDRFRIRGNPLSPAESLSGGNQQRLLLALLPEDPLLLLLEHPTRGLDMDSVQWVWEKLAAYAVQGTSIVFSSAELDEIFQMADRILVFFNGVVAKDVRTCDTTVEELAKAIAGKG
ncbi:MAG: ATP-binding cassette domain-containing protein [Desulfobacterota bacterium]|jgi:simple sugar transport system ATP-binding protein|nr:ATP-binding cassette domain-containing protein [Thermodesulfobacteriota bacterium]